MTVAAIDESAFNNLTLSMSERVRGKKQNYRVAFYMKSMQSGKFDTSKYRSLLFAPNENNISKERKQEPREGSRLKSRRRSACDEERGYCSDPETEDSDAVVLENRTLTPKHKRLCESSIRKRKTLKRCSSDVYSRDYSPILSYRQRSLRSSRQNTPTRKRNNELDSCETNGRRSHYVDENSSPAETIEEITKCKFSKVQDRMDIEENQESECKASDQDSEEIEFVPRTHTFSSNGRRGLRRSLKRRRKSFKVNGDMLPCKPALEDIVNSKDRLHTFREFLKSEFSEENLDFWLECENYKTLKGSKQTKTAQKIFGEYVNVDAPKEVNLDSKVRNRVKEGLKSPDKETFVEAQKSIFNLMKADSFQRYLKSDKFLKDSNTTARVR